MARKSKRVNLKKTFRKKSIKKLRNAGLRIPNIFSRRSKKNQISV